MCKDKSVGSVGVRIVVVVIMCGAVAAGVVTDFFCDPRVVIVVVTVAVGVQLLDKHLALLLLLQVQF